MKMKQFKHGNIRERSRIEKKEKKVLRLELKREEDKKKWDRKPDEKDLERLSERTGIQPQQIQSGGTGMGCLGTVLIILFFPFSLIFIVILLLLRIAEK